MGAFISGIAGIGGSILGGILGSSAAKKAAKEQSDAAAAAQASAGKYGKQASDFTANQLQRSQGNLDPFLRTGTEAQLTLSDLMKTPGQGLLQGFGEQFHAPSAGEVENTPGYQFQLKQGQEAIENSAASRGNLLSSTALKGLDQYSQGLASENYASAYQRSLGEFQQRYNIFNQNQANQFNRLSQLAGTGQAAANEEGQLGSQASGTMGNILLGTSGQVNNAIQAGGAARASGYIGSANAWNSAIGGATNSLASMFRPSGGSNPFENQQLGSS